MAAHHEIITTLRDIFPFGRTDDRPPLMNPPRSQNSSAPPENNHQENVLSEASFQNYKRREVSVNTQTNFLMTLNGYLNRITMALGGLATLAAAPFIPFVGKVLVTLSPAAAAASAAAFWPLMIGAVVFGVATLALGQYTTRLNTEKNTNNTDWFQKRNAAMIGQEVAKALGEQKEKHISRSDGKRWAEMTPPKQARESWQESTADTAPEARSRPL